MAMRFRYGSPSSLVSFDEEWFAPLILLEVLSLHVRTPTGTCIRKKRALCSLLMFRFSDIKPASTENQEVPITGARSSIAMLLSFFCLQSRLKILIPSVLLMGQLM